jgi:hypothetical protein
VVKRKTAQGRLSRAIKRVSEWCRLNRHEPIKVQQQMLSKKLNGHYGYYGITGNFPALAEFHKAVRSVWRKWLSRRSQNANLMWPRFLELEKRFPLARPRVVHSTFGAQ